MKSMTFYLMISYFLCLNNARELFLHFGKSYYFSKWCPLYLYSVYCWTGTCFYKHTLLECATERSGKPNALHNSSGGSSLRHANALVYSTPLPDDNVNLECVMSVTGLAAPCVGVTDRNTSLFHLLHKRR